MPVLVNCCVPHPPGRDSMHSQRHQAELVAGSQQCTVHVPEHKHSTGIHLFFRLLCASGHIQHTLHGRVRLNHMMQHVSLGHDRDLRLRMRGAGFVPKERGYSW